MKMQMGKKGNNNLRPLQILILFCRRKSLLERLKFNLFGKKKNESGKVQYLKTSSEEEDADASFSRASSGIGTMSTKSKITPEFDDDADSQLYHSNRDVSDCSIDDSKQFSKENIIPVIPRHNFGVFSRHLKYEARAARSSGKSEQVGNNIDKISIAENDDKDFEDFATKEEPDPENEFKVRDWHVMLENDHQSHNETLENEDVNVKYKSINQDKKTPERIAVRRRHRHKDARHTKNKSFYDESEHEKENFLNIKNAEPEYDHENTPGQGKEDLSDCSSKEDSKPAKKTLKKTFTSLLSKIQLGKLSTDGSSVTDTDSNCDISSRKFVKSKFTIISYFLFFYIIRKTK